jgi:predicted aspartyl protease
VTATTADGRRIRAHLINIDSMKIGAFDLKNVQALVCSGCMLLLGERTLSRRYDVHQSAGRGISDTEAAENLAATFQIRKRKPAGL